MECVDDSQHDKGTVDTDMMLNDNLSAEATEATAEQEDLHNIGEENGIQDDPMTSQEEPMEVSNETNVEKEVDEKTTNGSEENKSGDLDIESMLAAIHHDDHHENPSTNSEDPENIA